MHAPCALRLLLGSEVQKGSTLAVGGQWVKSCIISSAVREVREEVCTMRSRARDAEGSSNGLLEKKMPD